jgi:hypothetical protein
MRHTGFMGLSFKTICRVRLAAGIERPVLSARDAAAPLLAKVEGLPIYGVV